MRRTPVVLSLALWCACHGDAAAQADSTLTRAVARRDRVRIQVGTGTKIELRQPRIEGPMLVGQVGPDSARAEYPIQGITQVWRRSSAAGLGFQIGAAIGAVGGAALGVAFVNMCVLYCSSPSTSEELAGLLGGGLVGGLTVGGLGALFAASGTRWKSVYKTRGVTAKPIITPRRLGVSLNF